MKKLVKYSLLLAMSIICVLYSTTYVWAASAKLSGPGTVRAGDTITVKLNINDSGKYGVEGTLAYDSNVVTLSKSEISLKGWKLESNGNSLIMYDDAMTNPINGDKTVITLTFKVKAGVAAGTKVNIAVNNLVATDGSKESNLGSATYSTTIAEPLSGNANLSSLAVNGKTLSPVFAAGTTSYDIGEVEFSVSKLDITYKAEDSKSKVSVSGNSLSVGKNTVTVTVKAENGTTKSYKITVTRKQDPNYVASNDSSLSNIVASTGQLSPAFSKNVKDYIVYLPYETVGTKYVAKGTMSDSKAVGATEGSVVLVEGKNEVKVVGKAEYGSTSEYKITIVVLPKYDGKVPNIEGSKEPETEPTTEPTTEPVIEPESESEELTTEKDTVGNVSSDQGYSSYDNDDEGVSIGIVVLVAIIALILGFAAGYSVYKLMK